ncbi:GNAT family N-acetyltransferase [Terrimonas sp. NA20]|uniref:GNAT family N-acetyltransferase n=1 Tax=Terrimonas ginsenosidimutans TaxID=2908004 RepID=A0ABS9KTF2_9BACT|nr:GNAT family N-acetyltransferase [Terrimonas ginsenosidimutans]MCG2615568.1 GNAT family N-acetyltransferase [Terrimonas ginsenosidimutans]
MTNITIRPIQPSDNAPLAIIIRRALEEFGANHPGTVYYDASTDALYELFQEKGSAYFVALSDNEVVGGGGIFPTEGLPAGTCELVKMYLRKEARGTGLGKKLIETSLDWAKEQGYNNVYLETMPELKPALKVYEKFGFNYLAGPLGNSGHTGCTLWMEKQV